MTGDESRPESLQAAIDAYKDEYESLVAVADRGGAVTPRQVERLRQLVLDQAKSLYRYWPDVEVVDQLFVSR